MPFSAAWISLSHVGGPGGSRSGVDARAHAQVGGVLWRRQPEHRALRLAGVPYLQRRNVHVLSAPATASSTSWQAHRRRAGQRQVPPCQHAQANAAQIQAGPDVAVPPAIQPATGTY